MNKFICITFCVLACVASGNCNGYGNLAKLALGSYDNPSSSSASSSSAAAAAPNSYAAPTYIAPAYGAGHYGDGHYGAGSYGAGYNGAHGYNNGYNGHSYSAPIAAYSKDSPAYAAPGYKSYGPKYTVQPAYATELYPGVQNYKAYNSHPTYSQVALPIVPSAPVAKLYVPKNSYHY